MEYGTMYLLLGLLAGSSYVQSCTLITSNLLRADSEETFIVDGHGSALDSDIIIQDFPKKSYIITQGKISVNSGNNFLGTTKIQIPSTNLIKDPKKKQYVYVNVVACQLEKVIMVSYQSGYIFIQTDRPLYTPGSTVNYRVYLMTPDLKPLSSLVLINILTPDGITVKYEVSRPTTTNGILSLKYKIPELASVGTWSIVAKFESTKLFNESAQFEVKEYVLPSIEVKITSDQKFYQIQGMDDFGINIEARYLHGKPVKGTVFVLFYIKSDTEKQAMPETLRRVTIGENNQDVKVFLKREVLQSYFKILEEMLNWKLCVSATVFTDSGSDVVEAELNDILMVKSPYKISLTKTSEFYNPGMVYNVMVLVTNPDGSPASGVPVKVELQEETVRGETKKNGIAWLGLNTPALLRYLQFTVETADPKLSKDQQATAGMLGHAVRSDSYLQISAPNVLKMGSHHINLIIKTREKRIEEAITEIVYMIINKGRILNIGKLARSAGQNTVSMHLEVKPEFLPSFRLVAYYLVEKRRIVADSFWIDVEDACMGTLELSAESQLYESRQQPQAEMKLKLKADHRASVALVAVDKGVYARNDKFRFTQTKIWNTVEKYDTGCSTSGGADAAGVFHDAGLDVANNVHGTTDERSDILCRRQMVSRRRRDIAQFIKAKKSKESTYQGLELRCCQDGMRHLLMKIDCDQRAKRIQEGQKCTAAFLDCCRHIQKLKPKDTEYNSAEKRRQSLALIQTSSAAALETPRRIQEYGFGDLDYLPDTDIHLRTHFPESFLWRVETMDEAPDARGVSTKSLTFNLQDSKTTWEVLAVSVSEKSGICVSKPYDIEVMTDFVIDLKLPYSVVRNEQVELRAMLYNSGNSDVQVRVEWSYNENYCSLSTATSKYQQFVTVKVDKSVAVTFVIIPHKLGEHTVKVAVAGEYFGDSVAKKLKVVPEGKRSVHTLCNVDLNPSKSGRAGVQEVLVHAMDISGIVPNTPIETIVNIQGTVISDLVEKSIDGLYLQDMIAQPSASGQNNIMTMASCVIATRYLDIIYHWERIGVQRRKEALQYISDGLTQQLKFHNSDGSYRIWTETPPSTWLTAEVVKVFALAADLINIEKNTLCESVKWLLFKKQKPDGLFEESAPVSEQKLAGGITAGAVELDSTLTAFVLIAMLESEKFCTEEVNNLRSSIEKAISYITATYATVSKPYTIAIASYALAKAGRLPDTNKLMSASTGKNHWQEPGSHDLTMEATSYALLALLEKKMFTEAGPLVEWIAGERFKGQLFGASQSTVIMFEALAKYLEVVPSFKDLDLDISFQFPDRSSSTNFRLNNQNAFTARSDKTQTNGNFVVTARGNGKATLTVFSTYYKIKTEEEKECKNFDLSVKIEPEHSAMGPEEKLSSYSLTICAKFLAMQSAGMSIMEVSMLTGFGVDTNDLNQLKKGVDRYISHFTFNNEAFEKSTLVLYLDRVSHQEADCIKFKLHQYFNVGLIQPASVTVYEYNSIEANRCTKYYHMDEQSKLLGKICMGDLCRCAEASCYLQQPVEGVNAGVRFEKACKASVDYVYKTRLDGIQEGDNYLSYVMTITDLIKIGTESNPLNQKRKFISHARCRKALNLKVGQEYVVWGVDKDLWPIGNQYAYMITENTWIERWPSNIECQHEHRALCGELDQFKQELQRQGCRS